MCVCMSVFYLGLIVVILVITVLFTLRDGLDILSSASSQSLDQPQAPYVIEVSCFWFLKYGLSKRPACSCPSTRFLLRLRIPLRACSLTLNEHPALTRAQIM